MYSCAHKLCISLLIIVCLQLFPDAGLAQLPQSVSGSLTVFVQAPNGGPLDEIAVAELTNYAGQFYQQATTRGGRAEFTSLGGGSYRVSVVAAGYERATEQLQLNGGEASIVTIRLQVVSSGVGSTNQGGPPILSPLAKKELGKALEAMQAERLGQAHSHLEVAYRLAPGNPDVNYVFGLYCAHVNDWVSAKSHWEKVLSLYPKHTNALLSMGTLFLRENKTPEAVAYFKNAAEIEPFLWRAHALLADAYLRQGALDEGVAEAERAAELSPGQAPIVQPLLARALAKHGDLERATQILQSYLQNHPADTATRQQLADLQRHPGGALSGEASATNSDLTLPASPVVAQLALLAPPSLWLPPDVDETFPPVEPGTSCDVDKVLRSAGKRVQEFVSDVDRFTATETIIHETINKWGLASPAEKFKFDYLVSIQEVQPGLLNVEEYRPRTYYSTKFPDGVERSGLPALMLIFHPYYTPNFEMVCEGLAHRNGKPAWQLHFRQRSDRPNTIRDYRVGENGSSYPAALKGRAWIDADSFQIVRLETDLVAPLPQIQLIADRAAVEYGPVNFRVRHVDLWLPQNAEFYYDWKGHRGHRVHHFVNYLLFSVSDKERISSPKIDNASSVEPSVSGTVPQR